MKLNLLKTCCAFLIMGIMFISCEEKNSELVTPAQDINTITVKDGRLAFKSLEDLKNTVEKISGMDEADLNVWLKQFEGFKSSNTLENTEEHNWPRFLSIISNQNFLYQIGEDVFYLFNDSQYVIEGGKKEVVDKVLALSLKGKSIESVNGVTGYPIEREVIPIQVGNEKSNGENLIVGGAKYQRTFDSGGRQRKWVFEAFRYGVRFPEGYWDYAVEVHIKLESMYTKYGQNYFRPWYAKSYKEMRNLKIFNHTTNQTIEHYTIKKSESTDPYWVFVPHVPKCDQLSVSVDHLFAILTQYPELYPTSFYFNGYNYNVKSGAKYYHVANANWPKAQINCN